MIGTNIYEMKMVQVPVKCVLPILVSECIVPCAIYTCRHEFLDLMTLLQCWGQVEECM